MDCTTEMITQNPCVALAAFGGLTAMSLAKQYFNGGWCYARRDLTNKVVVITGANTGIGKESAKVLASLNATLVLACRSYERTKPVIDEIKKINSDSKIEFIALDLADFDSIRQFAKQFNQKYDKLDILLNNAGVMSIPQRKTTKQGLEMQVGTNHFGHSLLTFLLFDKIKAADQSRIINVSSMAHHMGSPRLNFEDFQCEKHYNEHTQYIRSKLANVMFTMELQRRISENNLNIKVVSLHPGAVRTELMRNVKEKFIYNAIVQVTRPVYWYFSKSALQGAQTNLYCCLEQYDQLIPGAYYADCKQKRPNKHAFDKEAQHRLFELTEQTVKQTLKI